MSVVEPILVIIIWACSERSLPYSTTHYDVRTLLFKLLNLILYLNNWILIFVISFEYCSVYLLSYLFLWSYHMLHKSSNCDMIKYVRPCLYHTSWWNGWCDIIEVRVYSVNGDGMLVVAHLRREWPSLKWTPLRLWAHFEPISTAYETSS